MISIIVLNIEARQYNIKINLTISYSPKFFQNINLWHRFSFFVKIFGTKRRLNILQLRRLIKNEACM